MSRIRSQLDTMLENDDGALTRPSRDEIRQRFENRLGELRRHASTANMGAREPSAGRQGPELDRIREKLDLLAEKIGNTRRASAPGASSSASASTAGSSEGSFTHSSDIENMAAQLREMRRTMEEISRNRTSQPDLSAITRSIEAGYADIAGMLQNQSDDAPDHGGRHLDDISGQLETLNAAVSSLPSLHALESLESRLKEIGDTLSAFGNMPTHADAAEVGAVEARLEELTRAVVSMSAEGGGNAIDRVEARLASLAKSVDKLVEDDRQRNVDDIAPALAELSQLPHALRESLSEIEARLSERGEGVGHSRIVESLAGQLVDLSEKLDRIASGDESVDHSAIEVRLDDIARRLDQIADMGTGAAANAEQQGDMLQLLHGLAARVDDISEMMQADANGTESLRGLDERLQGIVHRLDNLSADGADLSPLADRLESIEQQLALTRDVAIDVATQAAAQAVNTAGSGDPVDQELLQQIMQELKTLENETREGSLRHVQGFEALQDTLIVIADRLEQLDSSPRGGERPRHAGAGILHRAEESDPVHDDEESLAYPPEENFEPSMRRQEDSMLAYEPASDSEYVEAPFGSGLELPDGREGQPEEEIEDVPLEPGSGVPDLAALVRHASERRAERNAGIDEPREDRREDYLAAARRAAQAAARETRNAEADAAARESEAQSKSGMSAVAGKLRDKRRLAIVAAAFLLVAALAVPFALRAIGGSPPDVQLAEPAMAPEAIPAKPEAENIPAKAAAVTEEMPTKRVSGGEQADELSPAEDAGPADQVSGVDDTGDGTVSSGFLSSSPMPAPMLSATPDGDAPISVPVDPRLSGENRSITVAPMPPAEAGNVALRHAAASGDGRALFEIARRYTEGLGVERDLAEAAQWYELAADQGYPPAQYRLANFLEKGHGVRTDLERSALWYERAAKKGNALAMHNLAVLQTSGLIDGRPQMDEAIRWFREAADLGVKDSQVNLGIIYAKGLGVEEDLAESYKWFAVAARGGDSDAAQKRDTIASAMRPDQLEDARGAAEIWKARPIDPEANSAEILEEWKDPVSQSASLSRQALIARAQKLLAERGFDPGPADGLMGERTRNAIMEYQEKAGLPASGEITEELVRLLEG